MPDSSIPGIPPEDKPFRDRLAPQPPIRLGGRLPSDLVREERDQLAERGQFLREQLDLRTAERERLSDRVEELTGQLRAVTDERDKAYRERAHLVAYLAACHPSAIKADAEPEAPGWAIIYADTPAGQMSWHLAEDDLGLFGHVAKVDHHIPWDGHTTDEKYARLAELTRMVAGNLHDPLRVEAAAAHGRIGALTAQLAIATGALHDIRGRRAGSMAPGDIAHRALARLEPTGSGQEAAGNPDAFGGHVFAYESSTDLFRCERCRAYEVTARNDEGGITQCPGDVPGEPMVLNAW
jgi:hypothetical protein